MVVPVVPEESLPEHHPLRLHIALHFRFRFQLQVVLNHKGQIKMTQKLKTGFTDLTIHYYVY